MKANEYFKKHGYKKCKAACAQNGWLNTGFWIQLKRLVESYQLIQSYKGCGKPREHALSTAKFTLNHLKSTRELEIELYGNNDREVRLEQAILDVESCQ